MPLYEYMYFTFTYNTVINFSKQYRSNKNTLTKYRKVI